MSKTLYKLSAIVLATALTITGCNWGSQSDSSSETAPATSSDNGFSKGKFETPVTMTTVGYVNASFKFKNGETLENNILTKWVKDNLNIDIKYNWTTAEDQYKTKIMLDMSSGEEMPDVVYVTDPQLMSDLIDSGRFKDISEDFEKYASPEVKKIYEKDPMYWAQVTKDGKRYGLPQLGKVMNNDPLLWIRTDFLKKANLEEPKTLDDLEKVMEAMKGTELGNPPLAVSIKDGGKPYTSWRGDTSWVFGAYGVIPHYWNKWNGSDKLEYGSIQPEVKQALARLAEWYKKGYLSPDVAMIDVSKSDESFKNGKSGIMTGPIFQGNSVRNFLWKNEPDATVKPIPVPTGPDGKSGRRYSPVQIGAFLINKDFKNPEAFFLYVNKMFEFSNPKAGGEFDNGYFEGYDYVMKDGKPSSVEADFPDKTKVEPFKYMLGGQWFFDPMQELNAYQKFYNGEKPSTPFETKLYNSISDKEKADPKSVLEWQAAQITLDMKDTSIEDLFTGAMTETMKSKWEGLIKLETETFAKIIYGKAPVDEFDTFVTQWKELGGDKITEEVNAWYQSIQGE
ncbi:extracellular solute-binding protein [Paenibacillus shunpengii]|uniref:Extracellular solute-binding protein n=1 Tax=Paenibacillus shunpengii TaxID=2054424 RepID=A0ABW5SRI8_9BACL|nr:extracellular solute-binding protein [Paenibacillus sp. PDC88]SDX19674.1 putative aldouronate transport system substrate-binding protein [Paenibacillus sp. PDC88]